jgi:hypothetical protein
LGLKRDSRSSNSSCKDATLQSLPLFLVMTEIQGKVQQRLSITPREQ